MVSQIIAVLRQAEAGTPVPELCREHGISSAVFYKWRSKFGDMDALLMSQLVELLTTSICRLPVIQCQAKLEVSGSWYWRSPVGVRPSGLSGRISVL